MPRKSRGEAPRPEVKEPEQPRRCGTPGCQLPATGGRYCLLHEMVEVNRKRLEKQAKNEGDLMAQALLFGLSWLGPVITKATQPKVPPSSPKPPSPQPAQVNPFAVLGLEEAGCTEEAVRRRQREFARILHTDHGGGPMATARLAEINAAAAACLAKLRR